MTSYLHTAIFAAGVGQLYVVVAAFFVPKCLRWSSDLQTLPRMLRQLFLVYASYVVAAIVVFGVTSIVFAGDLAADTSGARTICGLIALFWGARLALQLVFDVRSYLKAWWIKLGFHSLTVLFIAFTVTYGAAAFLPR